MNGWFQDLGLEEVVLVIVLVWGSKLWGYRDGGLEVGEVGWVCGV